jgi:hypothetical protein
VTAAEEIANLTLRVQELEADLEKAEDERFALQERWDRHALDVEYESEERARTAVAEFVADVRRGIRDLDEYEAVFA